MTLAIRNLEAPLRQFVTLTYANVWPGDGSVTQGHWDNFARNLRRLGIAYVMIREYQARGAPHFHVWLSAPLPKDVLTRWWLAALGPYAQRGYHESQRVSRVTSWGGGNGTAAVYAAKYGAKELQKSVPFGIRNPGRFWAIGGTQATPTEYVVNRQSLRALRRGYQAKRREWGCRRRWRDYGRRGFTVRDMATLAHRILGGHASVSEGAPRAGTRAGAGLRSKWSESLSVGHPTRGPTQRGTTSAGRS